MKPRVLISIALFGVLLLAGCQRFDYIEMSPTDLVLNRRGEMRQLSAKAMSRQGHYYPEVLFDWSSEDPSVVTVDEKGQVKAVGSGRTYVVATAGKSSAKTLIEVNLVERIEALDPKVTLSLASGERVVPRIVLYGRKGERLEKRQVFLRPKDAGIVTVDGQGGLWPAKVGSTIVTAESEGKTVDFEVVVEKE